MYISNHASLICLGTIQSSVRNLAHASLETAVAHMLMIQVPSFTRGGGEKQLRIYMRCDSSGTVWFEPMFRAHTILNND